MEIAALLAGILAAVVFVAERLAFAIMMWMVCAWTWRVTARPRALLVRHFHWLTTEMMVLVGQFRLVREAIQHWFMVRSLHRQFRYGATP